MNIIDVDSGVDVVGRKYDVCIVGAGAAGCYLAARLARDGRAVALIEAGGLKDESYGEGWFDALQAGAPYSGATLGRFFGLGGSTSRWGGCLIPHNSSDLRQSDVYSHVWEHVVSTVSMHARTVLRNLKWQVEDDSSPTWAPPPRLATRFGDSGELQLLQSLYLPFRLKRLSWLMQELAENADLDLFVNGSVSGWKPSDAAHFNFEIKEAQVKGRSGHLLKLTFDQIIIAAGALESTRCLLEIRDLLPNGAIEGEASIGRYLSDHLSVSAADIAPESRELCAHLFAPRFEKGWMRSTRMIETEHAQRSFAHVIFENESRAFVVAKKVFLGVQARRWPDVSCKEAAAATIGGMKMAWDRYIKNILHVPYGTACHLQVDMEQTSSSENRIFLSNGSADSVGRRRLVIDWDVRPRDMTALRQLAETYIDSWGGNSGLPRLRARDFSGPGAKAYDAYHPVGTTRMGGDSEAVLDLHLRVKGAGQVWCASTSALPSAGTANPTFTLLCLCEGLVQQIERATS